MLLYFKWVQTVIIPACSSGSQYTSILVLKCWCFSLISVTVTTQLFWWILFGLWCAPWVKKKNHKPQAQTQLYLIFKSCSNSKCSLDSCLLPFCNSFTFYEVNEHLKAPLAMMWTSLYLGVKHIPCRHCWTIIACFTRSADLFNRTILAHRSKTMI